MENVRSALVAKTLGVGVLALLVLALAACGSEETTSDPEVVSVGREAGGVAQPDASGSDLAQSTKGEVGVPEEAGTIGEPVTPEDFGRKVVKTANLGLRSEEVRQSAAQAHQVAAAAGGSVFSSQVYKSEDSVTAQLILSVPSEEFERVLDELRGLGEKVTTDTVSGQDVTEEYVDLESRERNLRATEESLLRLYSKAENVEEALSIQRELTNVRGEIELVQGRIKYLDQHTAYSQITLDIQPVTSPPPPKPAWDPGDIAAHAWTASLGVLQAIATALISAIVFGWWLAPALVGGLLWWRRRNRPSRPATTEP
ncbi:MAG: DUF4349 domain-containing protein [Rubrobacteraceae bacterium]|nr:DUF4349 domain-containing protein [Rubrobacteraceae bacterium]MBA3614810.1 DUF4349 domain-containing protein [Rubrobacteraceae bacterium]MDQ3436031.1 DUF4349 domain-containing protein [Actinomycetota bacterium]